MPDSPLHRDLTLVSEAFQALGSDHYMVAGRPPGVDGNQHELAADFGQFVEAAMPVRALASVLYYRLYTGSGVMPEVSESEVWPRREHIERLSRANRSQGGWEIGWRLVGRSRGGQTVVSRDGVSFYCSTEELTEDASNPKLCSVWVGKELREQQQGYYIAVGGTLKRHRSHGKLVRCYWHLTSGGAARFLNFATTVLSEEDISFRLKILSTPAHYRRADAGVLLLDSQAFEESTNALSKIYRAIRTELRQAVPLFTLPLAPGLGFAEDPGVERLSFGMHRCLLVAGALWESWQSGRHSTEQKNEAIAEAFRAQRLDPAKPYLGPGSSDRFRTMSLEALDRVQYRRSRKERFRTRCLRIAEMVGDEICHQAIWHRDRCNWIGSIATTSGSRAMVAKALNSGLHSGSAGVSLFLANLFKITGKTVFRRAAVGAMKRSLAVELVDEGEVTAESLLHGRLGATCAAHTVSALTASEDLSVLVAGFPDNALAPFVPSDFGLGLATETELLFALQILAQLWGDLNEGERQVLDLEAMAAVIARRAAVSAAEALALVEWARITQYEQVDRAAGIALLAAEAHRRSRIYSARSPELLSAALLALARGRREQAEAKASLRSGTEAATEAGARAEGLIRHLRRRVAEADGDFSLRGLLGLVDLALDLMRINGSPHLRGALEDAVKPVVDRYEARLAWPDEIRGDDFRPSLMSGTAGLGYVLLRLADDNVPSFWLLDDDCADKRDRRPP